MRSAHCYSNENNDPLLAFQGFAISSFFFFFFDEEVHLNKQPLFLSQLTGNGPCLFLQRWQTVVLHTMQSCVTGAPDALEYTGFPPVMSGFTSLTALLASLLASHIHGVIPDPEKQLGGMPCLGRIPHGSSSSFPILSVLLVCNVVENQWALTACQLLL